MARENYYILLDLDPDKDVSWAGIEPKFRKAISVWSSQSATHSVPAKRAEYKEWMKAKDDIERVLKDAAARTGEADEARKLLQARKAKAIEELEEMVRTMAGDDGSVSPTQVKQLKARIANKKLTDADLTAALQRLGIPVKTPVAEKIEEKLDSAIAQRIRDTFVQLNKMRAAEQPPQAEFADLYEFLGLGHTSSNPTLLKTAETEYEKVRNLPKTGDVGLRQNLLGDCLSIFKTPDGRSKYDATLRGVEIEKLLELVDLAAAEKKLVTVKVMEEVIRRAAKVNIPQDRVVKEVKAHASKKGISVEVPSSGVIPANTLRCGACRELIPAAAVSCPKCGRAARVACPKCTQMNPSDAAACGGCNFAVGDMGRAEGLVRSAKAAFATDAAAAKALLSEALLYWPGHKEATALLAQLVQREKDLVAQAAEREKERQKFADAVTSHFARREFCAARSKVDDLARNVPDHPRLAEFRAQIAKAVSEAEKHATRAQSLEKQGKGDDALDAYQESVQLCADLPAAMQGLSRCTPAPPTAATFTANATSVTVRWQASPVRGRIVYRVVRKAGSQATRVSDGEELGRPADLTLTDSTLPPGKPYYYAVFADRGGVFSDRAAVAGPVVRVAEVQNLRSTAGNGKIELSWTPQPNAISVEVWRQAASPPARGAGTRVTAVLGNSVNDTGLMNGTAYGYRVIVVYNGADGKPIASAGVTEVASPTSPPRPIANLRITRDGKTHFIAAWDKPPIGEVRIYRLEHPSRAPFREGQQLSPADLESLGPRLPAAGPAMVREKSSGAEVLHLFPVTLVSNVAVAGKVVSQSWVEDVGDLTAHADGKSIYCRWIFPQGIDLVIVLVRTDRAAVSPVDPSAARHTWTRAQATSDGGFRCNLPASALSAFVTVFSAINRDGSTHYSEGVTVPVLARKHCRVRYSIVREKKWLVATGKWLLTISSDQPCELPELQLRGVKRGLPLGVGEGDLLVTILPRSFGPGEPIEVAFSAPDLAPNNMGLFPTEPANWLELLPR